MTTSGSMPGSHVFIVTYGRSGSTMLQAALNTIPGCLIRGENHNALLPLVQSWRAVETSESMRRMRRLGTPSGPDEPWYGAERVRPDAFARGLAETFSRLVLHPDPGTRISGFKEIRFHVQPRLFGTYLDFMRRFFPGARFVFNTRNHADVARSGWWRELDPQAVLAELAEAERLFADYAARHKGCSIAVHYDDYAAAPEALEPVFAFLGEPMDMDALKKVFGTRLDHARGSGRSP